MCSSNGHQKMRLLYAHTIRMSLSWITAWQNITQTYHTRSIFTKWPKRYSYVITAGWNSKALIECDVPLCCRVSIVAIDTGWKTLCIWSLPIPNTVSMTYLGKSVLESPLSRCDDSDFIWKIWDGNTLFNCIAFLLCLEWGQILRCYRELCRPAYFQNRGSFGRHVGFLRQRCMYSNFVVINNLQLQTKSLCKNRRRFSTAQNWRKSREWA